MGVFYDTVLTFPALLFSGLLIVVLMYWLLVILGALDMGGGSDADVDVDADVDADVDVDGADGFSVGNALAAAGLGGGPVSISFSLLTLFGWMLSVPLTYALRLVLPDFLLQFLAGVVALLIVLWLALMLTRVGVKPLRSLFNEAVTKSGDKLLGQVCLVTTGKVNESFGQASYDDGGAGLLLSVRANTPNTLKRGSKAVIVSYDAAESAYQVIPYDDVFNP